MADPWTFGWSSVVTWTLVFGGWFVVHQATLSRERRKEKREAARQICIDLRLAERLAIDFHTSPSHDSRKATDLRQDIERLILQLQRQPLAELGIPLSRMIQFRRSITRQNIDPSDFAAQTADAILVRDIRNAVTDLIESIEDQRENKWV